MKPRKLQLQKQDKFYLNKKRLAKSSGASFSLVEATLFLFVFAIGFTMLFTLVTSYIFTLKTAKEKIIANFLAQEGIELVLAKRNLNFQALNRGENVDWLNGLDSVGGFCINPDLTVISCVDSKLYLDSKDLFSHNINVDSKSTIFSRIINITPINAQDFQSANTVEISSEVNWSGKPILLKTIMTKWHPLAK